MALGNDPRDGLAVVLTAAGLASCAGAALNTRHRNLARQALHEQAAHRGDEPRAAETVVRNLEPPASSSQRELALAIIALRWREVGG